MLLQAKLEMCTHYAPEKSLHQALMHREDAEIREDNLINYSHQEDNKLDMVIRPIWKDNRSR